ncbi:MAG TPA: farnesyl diphosphate synthase [Candidatus Krumholzibacteria bacterium]|nr:farnesyl diphosphate synthase [Candidatus Krumholzibacteria bacterium]
MLKRTMRMTSDLDRLAGADRDAVETRLAALVDALASHHAGMREAIRYSLLGGGKRVRPLLCLWTHDALGGAQRDMALDAACALECVHTYSLVHDDLPCMDDDDLRRGRPSSHKQFGEAVAVLTGDALLSLGFEILATLPQRHGLSDAQALAATAALARAAGTEGLISGQALDLAPPEPRDAAVVNAIHLAKTAMLIAASMELGAITAGRAETDRARVRRAGLDAGLAFQITDDILDLEGAQETLGKTPRKDVDRGKLTLPSVLGIDAARVLARDHVHAALAELPEAAGTPLETLIRHIVGRSH